MKKSRKRYLWIIIPIILGTLGYTVFVPTSNFPVGTAFYINKGETEEFVLNRLEEKEFIKSALVGKIIGRLLDKRIQQGVFQFEEPLSLYQMMLAIRSTPGVVMVTIPEGFTKVQVAERLEKNLVYKGKSNFSKKEFLNSVEEGYIFPETYSLYVNASTSEIVEILNSERNKQINSLLVPPTREQIIMASILEREAKSPDMKVVAGILYNRLKIGMPLQVDATVLYAKGWKDRVTFEDLKHESEYNTYIHKGLPPGAISSPSLAALDAAMHPAKTDYLYYLTGSDGKMYYAKTFEEHVKNRRHL